MEPTNQLHQSDFQYLKPNESHFKKLFVSIPLAVVLALLVVFSVGAFYFGRNYNRKINNLNISPTITQTYPTQQLNQYQANTSPTMQINRMQPCQSDNNCPIIGYTDRECINLPPDCNTTYAKCIDGYCQQKETSNFECQLDSDCPQPGCASETDGNCMTYTCINNECVGRKNNDPSNPISKPYCKSSDNCPIPMVECKSNDAECFALTNPQCVNGYCESDYNNWPLVQTCFGGPEQNQIDWKIITKLTDTTFIYRNLKTGEVFRGTENNCE